MPGLLGAEPVSQEVDQLAVVDELGALGGDALVVEHHQAAHQQPVAREVRTASPRSVADISAISEAARIPRNHHFRQKHQISAILPGFLNHADSFVDASALVGEDRCQLRHGNAYSVHCYSLKAIYSAISEF